MASTSNQSANSLFKPMAITPSSSVQDVDEYLLPGGPQAWVQSENNLPSPLGLMDCRPSTASEPVLPDLNDQMNGECSNEDMSLSNDKSAPHKRRAHFVPTPTGSGDMRQNKGSGDNKSTTSANTLSPPSYSKTFLANGLSGSIRDGDHKESFTEKDHHSAMQQKYRSTRRRHYTDPVDFEGILNIIGGCSWWQIWVYLLISLQQIPHAMFNLSIVYMMYKPDHTCTVPGFDMAAESSHAVNWTWDAVIQSQMLYKLHENNHGANVPSTCSYIDRNESVYHSLLHMSFDDAVSTVTKNGTIDPRYLKEVPCNHWIYSNSVMTDTIVTEWDLVCTNNMKRAHAHLAYSLGFLAGCLLSGFCSDRFGRKPTVIGFGVLSSMFGLILPYSTYFPMFLLLRFLGAVCNEAADLAAYVLCMEITGTKYRAMVGSLLQAPWACGYALLALIAYLTRSWRSIQLVTAAVHTCAILLICVLPESPRWLIVNNRVKESEDIIRRACRMNKSYLPADLELVKHAEQRRWVRRNERATIFHLIKSRELIFRTLAIFTIWIATALVYYGLVIALSDQSNPNRSLFAGNFFVNNAIAGAIELPTLVGCVFLMRWGRKRSQMITLFGAGVFIICAMFAMSADEGTYAIAFFFLGKACIQAAFNILYIFTSELYPTVIRNSAVGACSMVARVGSAMSSYVAILSDETLMIIPMIIFSVFSLVAGALVIFMPETRDQPLPDTLQDAVTLLKSERQYQCAGGGHMNSESLNDNESPKHKLHNTSDHSLQIHQPNHTNAKSPNSILMRKQRDRQISEHPVTTIVEEKDSELPPPSPVGKMTPSNTITGDSPRIEITRPPVANASGDKAKGDGSKTSLLTPNDTISTTLSSL